MSIIKVLILLFLRFLSFSFPFSGNKLVMGPLLLCRDLSVSGFDLELGESTSWLDESSSSIVESVHNKNRFKKFHYINKIIIDVHSGAVNKGSMYFGYAPVNHVLCLIRPPSNRSPPPSF